MISPFDAESQTVASGPGMRSSLDMVIGRVPYRLRLPYQWTERPYQEALWDHLCGGGKRAIAVWHRRAGKDDVAMHYSAISACTRVGNIWHCLPEYAQGRKAIWTAVNPHTGKRRIDEAFPLEIRKKTLDNEMFIEFTNGSTWQIVGADRYNATVGSSPMGITYSEWALSNPSSWAYHRPMLAENDGWALFITTPRGRNHAKAMFDYAVQDPGWFAEMLTVRDTGALTAAQCDEALREYKALYGADVGRAQFEQEYLCSALTRLYWAPSMHSKWPRFVRRAGYSPIEPPAGALVHRSWDLGVGHSTSIWFFCVVGPQIYVLDHYAARGVGVEHYRDVIGRLYEERGWNHGNDYVPHDAKVHEFGLGRTRVETMRGMGLGADAVH